MGPPSFQEARARAEERVCTLLRDALCQDEAAGLVQSGGGTCMPWGAMAGARLGLCSGLRQYLASTLGPAVPQVSGACAGWHREPGAVLRRAVSNGPTPVSLG